MTTVAILQSNYLPWRGYFEIIRSADYFVFLEEVQYTKNDWRNRNRVKTSQGAVWITIPIITHGKAEQKICEARIKPGTHWAEKHWKTVGQNYRRAPYFEEFSAPIRAILLGRDWELLSELNVALIKGISSQLGITTKFIDSRELSIQAGLGSNGHRTDRIVEICSKLGASRYLSGPSARDYLEIQKFAQAGISLNFIDYSGYPEYPQLYPPFDAQMSIIDLLFNCGPKSPDYIWGWRTGSIFMGN